MNHRKILIACIASAASATAMSQPAQIEEISVIGQFVPDEKRATDAVSNVVNSEEFTRTGDANIAESLKRVAAFLLGEFVTPPGERYSTTF